MLIFCCGFNFFFFPYLEFQLTNRWNRKTKHINKIKHSRFHLGKVEALNLISSIIRFGNSQTCVQQPPFGPPKNGRRSEVVAIQGLHLQITINIEKVGIALAVVDRWLLFRGGWKHWFDWSQTCAYNNHPRICMMT